MAPHGFGSIEEPQLYVYVIVFPSGDPGNGYWPGVLLPYHRLVSQSPEIQRHSFIQYVKPLGGGTYVHDCDNMGVPAQPAGLLDITVLVCVLFGWHADQAEYV
jgi:hypothetical protein